MSTNSLFEWMRRVSACSEATAWVGDRTPQQAWKECTRGDWMLWALARTSVDRREVVRLCCDVALSVLPLTEDPRVTAAIDAAEGWCAGTVTLKDLCSAADAADAAADAAAADAASVTASAAAAAAYAADAAAYASAAADASASATYAADAADAAWGTARKETLAEIADLVRARISPARFATLVRGAL